MKYALILSLIFMFIPMIFLPFGGFGLTVIAVMFFSESLAAFFLFKYKDRYEKEDPKKLYIMTYCSVCFLKWVGTVPFVLGMEILYS